MKKKKTENKDIVLFQGSSQLAPGEFEEQGLTDLVAGLFGKKIKDVKADWEKVSSQIKEMIQATEGAQPTGYSLDSVTISLGFNAKGQLVFIAEAGVEATVSVTFKRA